MADTLRDLLIQRAARLQERPALTAPGWGTLSYAQLRNRAEGVALGILAHEPEGPQCSSTGSAWDWAAELAVAASGLVWDTAGQTVPAEVLGGAGFNDEAGRGPYHQRELLVQISTPFTASLDHGELMARLRRLNIQLGWDHATTISLPLAILGEAPVRAALWSTLYAGGHAVLADPSEVPTGFLRRKQVAPAWDSQLFLAFWQIG